MKEKHAAEAVAARIGAMILSIRKKVGEEGQLFGSVTASEIAELLAAHGVEIDRRKIVLTEPIKTTGTHTVPVKLHREVTAQATVAVVAEETAGEPKTEPAGEDKNEFEAEG